MEHRKYHWLYFLLGVFIAIIVATLMGCEQPETTSGIDYPPVCCAAMTPECEACKEGIPVGEWEENTCGNADVMGWDEEENSWMCGLVIID